MAEGTSSVVKKVIKNVSEVVSGEKYYLDNEDYPKMVKRISRFVASAEKTIEEMNKWATIFEDLMLKKKFIPGGRILRNAGTYFENLNEVQKKFLEEDIKNYKKDSLRCGQMLNCFVIPINDSKHGPASIYESLEDAADIIANEGGVGENFSHLRPKGFPIRGNPKYKASGPVSFLKLYNASSIELRQGGGRRGANMAVLNCDHPDVMEFVDCKRSEGTIQEYNISVGIYDDFMKAVELDKDWDLKWDGKVVKTIKAKDLFEKICLNIWSDGGGGEPGVLFFDQVKRSWPFQNENPECTNPCVTSDTWVMTDKGPRQVVDLIGKKFNAKVNDRIYNSISEGFWKTGNKDVYLLETYDGYSLKITKDHKIFIDENTKIPAEELRDGQEIVLDSTKKNIEWSGEGTFNEGYLMGFLVGDGTFGGNPENKKPVLSVWFAEGKEDVTDGVKKVMDFIYDAMDQMDHRSDWNGWAKVKNVNEYRIAHTSLLGLSDKFGIFAKEKSIGEKIHKASSSFQKGFLSGFFDADGSVQDAHNVNIRLTQNNLERLKQIQIMLQRFGIVSKIYLDRKKNSNFFGRQDDFNLWTHELVISKENVIRFSNIIGFIDSDKQDRLDKNISNFERGPYKEYFKAKFKSLTLIGKEDVYDVTISNKHHFNANGLIISNCGEQFLGNYEACDLGAMNIYAYVDGFNFNSEELQKDVKNSIRFLDNVLDLNNYPLKYRNDIARDISMRHRRIGLGIMGLADAMMSLGIGYGTSESIDFIHEVMHKFESSAHISSYELGKEKGFFLDFKEATLQFQNRRNCCVTTIAPTGTTSMIADVSGGCEPHFGLVVRKNTTDGSGNVYYMVPKCFEELCSKYNIELNEARKEEIYNNKGSVQGLSWFPEKLQKIVKTTMDITWKEHVEVQCALQKHIENSISKTINMPRSAKLEEVGQALMAMWKGGAKGCTIYRDGTRKFQIMNVGGTSATTVPAKTEKVSDHASEYHRPESLSGKTTKIKTNLTTNNEHIYITINEDETKKPFEIFVSSHNEKTVTDFLDFLIQNNVRPDFAQLISGKVNQLAKENVTVTTRLISLCLRSGVPIKNIVKQLRKINHSDLNNLHKKIAKLLSHYIPDDEQLVVDTCGNIVNGSVCGDKLIYQSGCVTCQGCGYSKCE